MPSKLEIVLWSNSLEDLRTRSRLKFGYEYIQSVQEFCHLAKAVSMVFGGGEASKPQPPKNIVEAQAQFASIFGG